MASYQLVTYQSEKGPRAGIAVGDKLFDAAALTRKAAYATMLDILNDWQTAQGHPEEGRRRPPARASSRAGRWPRPSCWRRCCIRRRSTAPAPTTPTT